MKLFEREFMYKVLIVGLPIFIQEILIATVVLVDNFMVGSLGAKSIAAVSAVNSIYLIFAIVAGGLVGAAGIYSAQYFGAKKYDKVMDILRIRVTVSLVFGIIFSTFLFIFTEEIVSIYLKQDTEAINIASRYAKIALFTYPIFAVTTALSWTLKEGGISISPMIGSLCALIINLTLDYVLIFGKFGFEPMGVEGAAYATLIARIFELIVVLATYVFFKHNFKIKLSSVFHINVVLFKKIFKKALPLMFNEMAFSVSIFILFFSVSSRGTDALAAFSMAFAIFQIAMVSSRALGATFSVLIGYELGTNDLEKARDRGVSLYIFSVLFVVLYVLILSLFAKDMLHIYDVGEDLLDLAYSIFIVLVIFLPFETSYYLTYYALRASGRTAIIIAIDGAAVLYLTVPAGLFGTYFTSFDVVSLLIFIKSIEMIRVAISFIMFSKLKWIRNLTE